MVPASFTSASLALAPALKNHLWQSTLFLLLAALLALVLRSNRARERYWLWMAASLKFLLPFALLAGIGSHFARPHAAATAQPAVYFAVEDISEPFALQPAPATPATPVDPIDWSSLLPALCAGVWLAGFIAVLAVWCVRWRRVARAMRASVPLTSGREFDKLRQIEQAASLRRPIELRLSVDSMEPGVFGILRPVLAWPAGISQRLDDAQLDAILAHEVSHVRRRDNLTAAVHMLVEAVFWFHPLVWWLGARLIEERERACDQEVLRLCSRPEVYAEGILKVCEFCLESPLPCVSGVTGSDLKRRIGSILAGRIALKLGPGRKLLLLAAALLTVAVPILLGQARAAQRMALAAIRSAPSPFRAAAHALIAEEQTPSTGLIANEAASGQDAGGAGTDGQESEPVFEVASIRPSAPDPVMMRWQQTPDGLIVDTLTLKGLITYAYGVLPGYVFGGPDWTGTELFDINAKFGDKEMETLAKLPPKQRDERAKEMLRNLLVERFKLKVRQETKESAIYTLVLAKGGPKLTKSPPQEPDADGQMPPEGGSTTTMLDGRHIIKRTTMQGFAMELERDPEIARDVVDGTGLKGPYDFEYTWKPSQDGSGPSLFTALQEQLGLKLVPSKGPIETLVIDSAQKPSVDGAEVPGQASVMPVALAQEKPSAQAGGALAAYDVVSVKPVQPTRLLSVGLQTLPDGIDGENVTVAMLTQSAYSTAAGLPTDDAVTGLPDWAKSEYFAVEAKMSDAQMAEFAKLSKDEKDQQRAVMLQALLADRFKLQVHHESRQVPGYELVVEKGGPKFQDKPNPDAPLGSNGRPLSNFMRIVPSNGGQEMIVENFTMGQLAGLLSGTGGVDHRVVDKTGLAGKYNYTLTFALPQGAGPAGGPMDTTAPDPAPTLFNALEDQLGLKLQRGTETVDTVVVDHVERPTPN